MLQEIIMNKVLIIPLFSWAIAQLCKIFIILIREKRFNLSNFFISGGMPSSHSALVTALTTSVALIQGISSVSFGISIIFTFVVMYDAAGVRRSVGQQSRVLNRILQELRFRHTATELGRDLKELIGHTRFEVIIGGLLGIGIAWSWLTMTGT
ncbi:divergent PAP2 family protein [Chloroflexota bacterium]